VGGLAIREHDLVASGRDLVSITAGESRVVFEAPEGVTGFNDMAIDAAGRIYVGALRFRPFAGENSLPGDVWRVDPDGVAELLFRGIHWPNGIGLSPSEDVLYCCDYANGTLIAHDLDEHGRTSNWRLLAATPSGEADGLAIDHQGGVWVATGNGATLARFAPDGSQLETAEVPAPFVSALCFGGEDLRDLYVTTMGGEEGGSLLRGRAPVAGA
jgi:sugar lactone lactonase YvrE